MGPGMGTWTSGGTNRKGWTGPAADTGCGGAATAPPGYGPTTAGPAGTTTVPAGAGCVGTTTVVPVGSGWPGTTTVVPGGGAVGTAGSGWTVGAGVAAGGWAN